MPSQVHANYSPIVHTFNFKTTCSTSAHSLKFSKTFLCLLDIQNCIVLPVRLRSTFKHCAEVEALRPNPHSGVYQIRPSAQQPCFDVFCNFTEAGFGWMKILQIAQPYNITNESFGNIAVDSNFTHSAKLSDEQINSIAYSLKATASSKNVYYRISAADTAKRVYAQTDRHFDDLISAWNILAGSRRQCLNESYEHCHHNWKDLAYKTLDTFHDGTGTGEESRYFTDHDGHGTERRCWVPFSPERCVSGGEDQGHRARQQVELWIGSN